jgi:hypothetical protein
MLLVHSTSLTFIHSLAYRFNVKAVELEKIPDHRDRDFEVCHLQVRIITDNSSSSLSVRRENSCNFLIPFNFRPGLTLQLELGH